ncbi:hypothetical protein CP532_1935 [Ophiocordyceps camponoti-leonardi (nom. inval.)]|nr:hypothetical protein CP532_1935 [Ophiocordyceps camponoti-leonardi (nom. inval.)]
MIDLNPLVTSRQWLSSPPPQAPPQERGEEYEWYAITDRLCLCAGVTYTASFRDCEDGSLATHTFAPLGLEIRGLWQLIPAEGPDGEGTGRLAIRETVDLRCGPLLAPLVESTLKNSHKTLVKRFSERVLTMGEVGFR